MVFHHINPKEKEFNISGNLTSSLDKLQKEINKCQLLCSNCHHEIHEKIDSENNKYKIYTYKEYKEVKKLLKEKNKIQCPTCNKVFYKTQKHKKYCSGKCYDLICKRPSKEELEKIIWKQPTTHIAKIYGVSDKAVEKWCKTYNISKPPRGYWTNNPKEI